MGRSVDPRKGVVMEPTRGQKIAILVLATLLALLLAATAGAGTYKIYAESGDGYLYGRDLVRADACANCYSKDTTSTSLYIGERYTLFYEPYQTFMTFRIAEAGIPEGETIVNAKFMLYIATKSSGPGEPTLTINKIAYFDPLTCADWNPTIIAELCEKGASTCTAGQYNAFPVQAEDIDEIEKNVTLAVWIDELQMCIGTPPTADWRWLLHSSNFSGTSHDPYIQITTTSAGTPGPARLGVGDASGKHMGRSGNE